MGRYQNIDYRGFVDVEKATVDRIIYSDQSIYEEELEKIFARAWNFMCHESQIKKPGDFFLNFIGEESVIATRDKKGELQVLLNSCRHRGNAVCRAESGNARSFLCTYHGWTYSLDGSLIGVPGYKDFYHEQLDKSQWGLVRAAKVASYKGFVFATMDPEAPELNDYLGPVGRMGIDLLAERGDIEVVEGVQKNVMGCNWKLAVDNIYDWYHAITHASAMMSGFQDTHRKPDRAEAPPESRTYGSNDQRVVLGEYGHAIGGPRVRRAMIEAQAARLDPEINPNQDNTWRLREGAAAALGDVGIEARGHPGIFPNLWVTGNQVCLRIPRGPSQTEIWWFTLVDPKAPPRQKELQIRVANHLFGPAGLFEQDDGENWDQSTRQTKGVIQRRYPLHFAMNHRLSPVQVHDGVTYVDTHMNEHCQLWTYQAWADWMSAESWPALKASRSPAPVSGNI